MNRELAAAKRRNSLASALSATYIFNVRLSQHLHPLIQRHTSFSLHHTTSRPTSSHAFLMFKRAPFPPSLTPRQNFGDPSTAQSPDLPALTKTSRRRSSIADVLFAMLRPSGAISPYVAPAAAAASRDTRQLHSSSSSSEAVSGWPNPRRLG